MICSGDKIMVLVDWQDGGVGGSSTVVVTMICEDGGGGFWC